MKRYGSRRNSAVRPAAQRLCWLHPVCPRPIERRAFTLVEVVAGTALMALLLTGVLMAYGRHARQIRKAHVKLAAITALDQVLADWSRRPSVYQGHLTGYCGERSEFRWRVDRFPSPAATFGAQVLRWQVYSTSGDFPLAQVDVLDPIERAAK